MGENTLRLTIKAQKVRIAELEAENARLREALEPFAEIGKRIPDPKEDLEAAVNAMWKHGKKISLDSLRRAVRAFNEGKAND